MSDRALRRLFLAIVALALLAAVDAWSLSVWALEVVPVAIALPVLWWTRDRLRFTPLVDWLVAARCVSC
jgi:putative membrane protein